MTMWTEEQSEAFLKKYINVAESRIANSANDAAKAAKKFGYPVVVKVSSPEVVHKTEVAGVKIVHSEKELIEASKELLKIKNSRLLIQEYVKGLEFIIGIQKDPTFGHVVMVGLGGIFVEVFKDISFRACPIDKKEAIKMMKELKSSALFGKIRGITPKSDELAKMISEISKIPTKHTKIKSLDINPVILNDKNATAVDARIEWQ